MAEKEKEVLALKTSLDDETQVAQALGQEVEDQAKKIQILEVEIGATKSELESVSAEKLRVESEDRDLVQTFKFVLTVERLYRIVSIIINLFRVPHYEMFLM
jgi:hypothetical protein